MKIIRVRERVQCGDIFLLKFMCPECGIECLEAYPIRTLWCCSLDVSRYALSINRKRVVQGYKESKAKKNPNRKSVPKRMVMALHDMQDGNCAYCGGNVYDIGVKPNVDHIIPVAAGGTNDFHNLCLCCSRCNYIAGSKLFATFEAKKEYIVAVRKKKALDVRT